MANGLRQLFRNTVAWQLEMVDQEICKDSLHIVVYYAAVLFVPMAMISTHFAYCQQAVGGHTPLAMNDT